MCGIVGAVANRDVVPILIDGLKRLEYRGYDSAGTAVINGAGVIHRARKPGKVKELEAEAEKIKLHGNIGIAHTRWATHGKPTQSNAHPHICRDKVAVVHNGIIENHEELREQQKKQGYEFTSETDTEVIVHQIFHHMDQGKDILEAVKSAVKELEGAYALGVISIDNKDRLITARRGSPLVLGIADHEYFIASDVAALIPVTKKFIFLEEGDIADIKTDGFTIYDIDGNRVERKIHESKLNADAVELGKYSHYMLKEIYEQPLAITETLEGRISNGKVLEAAFGPEAAGIFDKVQGVHIIACGTSYHAGMVGRYWLESIANIPCSVEVASEFRYRKPVVRKNQLIVTLSQSGETADT
ncbi:MAG: glutamine--fructose-6-phosphate transaminase (isomerizing), partial [Gammaproteobacteria bacterium]|nr:glutamine--fructose-6-phosphate transaminase (isomerizing) [Gammaproteobacteria bacterium]